MWLPAELLAGITGKRRRKQEIWWRSDSVVHNLFILWKWVFWARNGIRFENSISFETDGKFKGHSFGTWEAWAFHYEEVVKSWIKKTVSVRVYIPVIQTSTGRKIFASPYLFAIAFDTSTGAAGNPPSFSITRGTADTNYIGLVFSGPYGASRTNTAMTWGGNAMTGLWSVLDDLSGGAANGHLWYYVAPGTGATTITGTTSNTYGADAAVFSGVHQTTPFDPDYGGTSVSYVSVTDASLTVGEHLTVSGTSHIDNSLGVGWFNFTATVPDGGTNTTTPAGAAWTWCRNVAAVTPAGTAALDLVGQGSTTAAQLIVSYLQPVAVAAGAGRDARELTLLGSG